MKKAFTLLVFCWVMVSQLAAQSPLRSHNLRFKQEPMPRNKVAFTGMEAVGQVANPNLPLLDRSLGETTIGETVYDLQSNSSTPNRLTKLADGTLFGTYTIGFDAAAGYPDRGTGYNVFTPSSQSWGAFPTARVEDVKTGWPSVVTLADGTPVTIAHTVDAKLHVSKQVGGVWQYSDVPTAAPPGLLWPRMEVGGADGNTLHVIAITLPIANGGAVYEGCNGHLLYFRSTDGGDSWDIQDLKLPEMDNAYYSSMDGDSYAIDASGETVAVGLFGDYGDVKIAKSSDNGSTWTTWTVKDFPIDGYVLDAGYTVDQLPFDPNAPDTLAIQSSDNAGDVLVDNDGGVHLWYGEMYIMDDAAANSSYYPATMGLHYWNESMAQDASVYAVEGIIDANSNDTLDIAGISDIALYYASLTSHPSAGIDADGRIYVAFSGLTENYINTTANPNQQHNRHVYIIYSEDNGAIWSDPLDLTSENYLAEFDLIDVYETMFPAIARYVDYRADIIYQQDFEPGLAVRGDMDAAGTNYINHIGLDVADLGIINNTTTVNPDAFAFNVSPNPASVMTLVNFELASAEPVTISVSNALGQVVKSAKLGLQNAGKHGYDLNTAAFSDGLYIVTLQAGDKIASNKLVVR
ncbi:MAG: T9SS type A sorting domain-containing protein [Saprospiraceae bacterium]|nr:T9SS type A sorting domain-containing protein [Saprospiraceae bacterium]